MVAAMMIAALNFALGGCGGGSSNNNINPVGSGGTSSTTSSSGTTPAPSTVGNVTLVPTLTAGKDVPTNVTQFKFTGLDVKGQVQYTNTVAKASPITLTNVPITVTTLKYDLLAGGQNVGSGVFAVTVAAGQTVVINNPPWDPIVVGSASLLPAGTRYELTGADMGSVTGGVINGYLIFDGAGKVTSGQFIRQNIITAPNPTTTFNVTGGTYTVASNRNFTATLTTSQYPITMTGQVSLSPAGGAIYAALYGNNSTDALSGLATLQIDGSGFSVSSIKGDLAVNAFDVSFASPNFGFGAGKITFDGAGKLSGSLTGRSATTTVAGSYTVTSAGVVSASVSLNGGASFTMTGAVGSDAVLSLAGSTGNSNLDEYYFLGSPVTLGATVINVQPTMRAIGMRTLTGGLRGDALFNAGNNTVSGGSYDEFSARTAPVTTTNTAFQGGSFTVTTGGALTGSRPQGSTPLQLVGGVFTQSQSVFFGVLVGNSGDPLQFDQQLMILAK